VRFPREEVYSLTSQFRRAAISIAANIAEGYKKKGKADKLRFYNIAEGSLSECQYYCILAEDLNYGKTSDLLNLSYEVEKLLVAYCRSIKNSQ
jgi:four helix bundle protein